MFSDGAPRLPDHDRSFVKFGALPGRRLRAWAATGITALVLAALAVPSPVAAVGDTSTTALLSKWAAKSKVSVIQDANRALTYTGRWINAAHPAYLDGRVRSTNAAGAKVSLKFTGTAVAWTGPVGPTRGTARVFIDGKLAATVSTRASSFRASRVLFTKTWSTAGAHRISIITNGTVGHPTVAVDAFLVRRERTPSTEVPAGVIGTVQAGVVVSVPTPAPTGAPAPTPTPTMIPTPTAAPTAAPSSSVRVSSIPALLTALADNAVSEIVVANGTYKVSPSSSQASNSLWIGSRFAGRTRAVTVRAETRGGVTLDGGGSTAFGGLTFAEGAHHQTWDGFTFANGSPIQTGVIVFGGYAGRAAPHHITLRSIKILPSVTGHNDRNDHAVYFSYAKDGPHDLLIDGLTVDATGSKPLSTALHFYHSDGANDNAWNTTIRNLRVTGTYTAISMWDSSLHDITIDGATIKDARYNAMRYEEPGRRITLANMTSTGSGQSGFYSSAGSAPPGVTFVNTSFR